MHALDYTIIAIYLALIVGIGVALQRRASRGIDAYFLGNRKMPWWVLGASGMASNTDISGTMINTALVYALGTLGLFIEIRGGAVLLLAFLIAFMGKWARRSQVMTLAEWMRFRFGTGRAGNTARVISAVANITLVIAMVSYFSVGSGKFAAEFLDINWRLAALLMAGLATLYTVASGLYGVVWTDVVQGVFIFIAISYIVIKAMIVVTLPESFSVSVPLVSGGFETINTTLDSWSRLLPPMELNLPGAYSKYNLFGIAVFFYLVRVTLEGSGGGSGYMAQRYFASRSDRDAGLLALFWTLLLFFRWPLIAAFAMLGVYYGATQEVIADPERVLPVVIDQFLPIGIKGLVVAGFLAAAMSTFDSTVNAGASYWVKDIYQAFIKRDANERQLMRQSRISSLGIVVIGFLVSFSIANINDIWGWITMGISGGLFIPLVLRWYWWRFNGYGFAVGTLFGLTSAILARLFFDGGTEYYLFLITSGSSLTGCILGTLATARTDPEVLQHFYRRTRPFGFWHAVRRQLDPDDRVKINAENRKDILVLLIALPWQFTLFLSGILFVFKQWDRFFVVLSIVIVLSVALYFMWFRRLSDEVTLATQDA
jgi:Na+/proline symporter